MTTKRNTLRFTRIIDGKVDSKCGTFRLTYIYDAANTYWIVELFDRCRDEYRRCGDGATLRNAKHDAQLTQDALDNGETLDNICHDAW